MKKFLFVVLCFWVSSTACAPSKIASDLTSGIFKEGAPIFEQESDVEVAETAGIAMIKTLEVFHHHNPTNKTYLNLLARSYATYAFGFLETRMLQYKGIDQSRYQMYENRAKGFYQKGKHYGMLYIAQKDMKLYRAFSEGVDVVRKRVSRFSKHQIDGIFWAAFNWGGLINLSKDDIVAVADLVLVEALMAQVLKVYPGFYYGAPHLFYGVYYASRPGVLGGDPTKSRAHFEEAAKVTKGRNLMVYALQAQYLATQLMDQVLFHELLNKVVAGSIEDFPEQRLANVLAKERVPFLKRDEKNYF